MRKFENEKMRKLIISDFWKKKEPKIRFWYFLVSSCFFVDVIFGIYVDDKGRQN